MSEKTITPNLLHTRRHFEILDGMRGIAALSVVTFHFMEIAYSDYRQNFIGHGFLAVDFFFCLSGFVIGYAYDGRIGKMGVWEFFKSRLIRLHPMVVFGTALGLLALFVHPFDANPQPYSAGSLIVIVIFSLLMVPYHVMPNRVFNQFGLNAPAWSLFWEYIANIVYALILCRVNKRLLVILAIIAGAGLCWLASHSGNLMGGWGKGNTWEGGIRIAYSFCAGLLVYRFNWIIKNRLGFLGVGILLFLAFVFPFSIKWNPVTEPLIVLFYFPLMVALGAGATLSDGLKKLCNFAGNISYPLYMTHYCVMFAFAQYDSQYKPSTGHLALIIIAGLVVLTGFAYLVMIGYDMPVRKYFNKKRKQGLPSSK